MANLNSLDVVKFANDGAKLELVSPLDGELLTDEGEKCADPKNVKTFYVRVFGQDSDTYKSALAKSQKKHKKIKNQSEEETINSLSEIFAASTTDCYLIEDNKPVECTLSNMIRIYKTYPWLREQAASFMAERSNFTPS